MKIALGIVLAFSVLSLLFSPVLEAEDGCSPEIMAKLEKISQKEDKILEELEKIKSELNVVKIRATLNN